MTQLNYFFCGKSSNKTNLQILRMPEELNKTLVGVRSLKLKIESSSVTKNKNVYSINLAFKKT